MSLLDRDKRLAPTQPPLDESRFARPKCGSCEVEPPRVRKQRRRFTFFFLCHNVICFTSGANRRLCCRRGRLLDDGATRDLYRCSLSTSPTCRGWQGGARQSPIGRASPDQPRPSASHRDVQRCGLVDGLVSTKRAHSTLAILARLDRALPYNTRLGFLDSPIFWRLSHRVKLLFGSATDSG